MPRRNAKTTTAPHDPQAEAALLGAMIFDAPHAVPDVLTLIDAEDLHELRNAAVFRAVVDLHTAGIPVDLVTLRARLEDGGQLENVGGPDRLAEIAEAVPHAMQARQYAERVHECATWRRVLDLAQRTANRLSDTSSTAGDTIDSMQAELTAIGGNGTRGPLLARLADVEPQEVRWLWPSRIPMGKITLIAGDPGLGKSFLTLDIASRVSTGAGWPDRPGERVEPRGVVLLSAEDDAADTIVPRLMAAGADLTRIEALQAVQVAGGKRAAFDLSRDVHHLREAVRRVAGCELVVVDPVSAYLGATDSHVNAEVRSCLAQLAAMAGDTGVAVVLVSHLNKGGESPRAIYRITGSLAFAAAARAVWAVTRDEADRTRRLMMPVKLNLAAADTNGLAYSLAPPLHGTVPCIAWEAAPVAGDADDAMREPTAVDEAVAFLQEVLADGPMSSTDLRKEADERGIGWRTVNRAQRRAGVVAEQQRSGDGTRIGGWMWRLIQHR